MDHAKRGADALSAGKYAEAVQAYTAAIAASSTSPDYYIKRSTAHQRSSPPDFASALSDAENGVVFAQKRAKRELIVQAQLRRSIALFGLERYGDAGFVLEIVKRMDPKEKMVGLWENKIKGKLQPLGKDDPKTKVTAKETPDLSAPATVERPAETAKEESKATNGSSAAPIQPAAPAQTPANKIRHDWYQTNDTVIFTLMAKGVPKDKAVIDIQERSLTISFPLITESTYDFSLDPLYAPIDPSQSKSSILSTKVEITLKKKQPGQKWHALESNEPVTSDGPKPAAIPQEILDRPSAPVSMSGPAYPTSSRSGPKNWDKLATDLTKPKAKKDGDSKAAAGDDDEWDYEKDEDGDAANAFFKKLYKGASPDVQRAMMKSYTESNGTALSTNWSEVSKGPVPTQPPDSMVEKKWGE